MLDPNNRQCVGRLHVGESNRTVIRYVISRLVNKHRTFRAMSRSRRRAVMQQCVEAHRQNRELYGRVMTGRW